ncbi:MAG: hypothetical protein NZL87_05210 [Thermomicrobium sp.]|nr:hypothetical protein [Thermomicrobium sp.]
MTRLLHPEFPDELSDTNYPFADGASLTSDTGYSLRGCFLDGILVPPEAAHGLHLPEILIDHRYVRISLADSRGRELGEATFYRHQPSYVKGKLAIVLFTDTYGREIGILVSDPVRLASLSVWEPGKHRFQPEATELVARCCHSLPDAGLQGFLVGDELMTGDVVIVGHFGFQFNGYRVLAQAPDIVSHERIVAVSLGVIESNVTGDPLFRRRLCAGTFRTPRFLRELQVVAGPDRVRCNGVEHVELRSTGHFEENTVLRVGPGLRFEVAGPHLRED